jgi:hypothetical protein
MPFDALVAAPRPYRLSDALEDHGIKPVSRETLTAHKLAQLEKFVPSFWYRHQDRLLVAALIAFTGIEAIDGPGGLTSFPSSLPSFASIGWVCGLFLLVAGLLGPLRAGSHWVERMVLRTELERLGVPAPIATMARKLHQDVPGSGLILGELMQDRAVLDPYLMLEYGHERMCLGIWEGRRIIACASEG